MKKSVDEWEALVRAGRVDLVELTRNEVEHCHGFCWTCVKRWCPWNETPPIRWRPWMLVSNGSCNTENDSLRAINSSVK